ncbi:MAG: alpha/beta hydrolase [Microthrixaceae bacterium]
MAELTTEEQALGNVSVRGIGVVGSVDALDRGQRSRGLGGPGALDAALSACEVTVQEALRIDAVALPGASASDEPGPFVELIVPAPVSGWAQMLLVEDDDGRKRWLVEPAPETSGEAAASRGASTATVAYRIPADPGAAEGRETTRGLVGTVVKKVVKVLAFRAIKEAGDHLANHFAAKWEASAHPYVLRRYAVDNYETQVDLGLDPGTLVGFDRKPTLLILHGIMARSHDLSGFGSLPRSLVGHLNEIYDGRVLAFDHPTVSVGPTANVERLYQALGDVRPHFDLLCHSRGGLVARQLVEGPAPGGVPRMTVRGLAMAGTPNTGTPLADTGHLGKLVDMVTNMIDFLPDNPVTDTVGLLISVLKQLAVGAMEGLEGIAAMQAESELLTALNTSQADRSSYRAIASDFEPTAGSPLSLIARDLAMDTIFGTSNDLLVPTEGVYLDSRPSGTFDVTNRMVLTADKGVQHSGYWRSPDVVAWLSSNLPFSEPGSAHPPNQS